MGIEDRQGAIGAKPLIELRIQVRDSTTGAAPVTPSFQATDFRVKLDRSVWLAWCLECSFSHAHLVVALWRCPHRCATRVMQAGLACPTGRSAYGQLPWPGGQMNLGRVLGNGLPALMPFWSASVAGLARDQFAETVLAACLAAMAGGTAFCCGFQERPRCA